MNRRWLARITCAVVQLGCGSSEPVPTHTMPLACTRGALWQALDGSIRTESATLRAVTNVRSDNVALQFHYVGASDEQRALSSGQMREQIGLKLRAQDSCNVLYLMWRFAPRAGLAVSVKYNPGETQHEQCGVQGYQNVAAERVARLPAVTHGSAHVLAAQLDGARLSVEVDRQIVWQGTLPMNALAIDGPVGVRSDNVEVDMILDVVVDDAIYRAVATAKPAPDAGDDD